MRSTDPAHRSRARRTRTRYAALRGPVLLLALLLSAALAAGTTNAQDERACDPNAPAGTPGACPPAGPPPGQTVEEEPPEEEKPPPPPKDPEPKAPPPEAPAAPPAPQREVCPDGTWAPCPDPSTQAADPDERQEPRRKRSCRKRPGIRRPKYCPRLRRDRDGGGKKGRRGKKGRDGDESPTERRRAALRRAEQKREQCEQAVAGQLAPVSTLAGCPAVTDIQKLYVAGRLPSRPLPDPLPPGSRLDGDFAALLERVAGKRWPVVLAMLRAQGKTGAAPAKAEEIGALVEGSDPDGGDERVKALTAYHRAVGLAGLTRGMHAVKAELTKRVLSDGRISLYPGGRFDVSAGRIDVRVLVTMLYLAERHGGITVTSLISGHGILTKSGGVSLHSYGHAMDIAAVGGVSILGNQEPGGATESALRSIMMLPAELQPSELISLFAMGGPSFAMADHADHIHVGF